MLLRSMRRCGRRGRRGRIISKGLDARGEKREGDTGVDVEGLCEKLRKGL